MQREFTEDQAQFRELVARFMQSKAGPAAALQLKRSVTLGKRQKQG